ncbi:MAG: right-handed parallel beta-helix repeat-containing protein [Alteromonadaceae bacterium]|nr:right-handed parallel beta-helix repeat-containing protein [Alteromonadaceae bacterium]
MLNKCLFLLLLLLSVSTYATDYYINAEQGNDSNSGKSIEAPWQTLIKVKGIQLQAGDRLLLGAGQEFLGNLEFSNILGTAKKPILISTYQPTYQPTYVSKNKSSSKIIKHAKINAKGKSTGILLIDSSYINISNLSISANGGSFPKHSELLRSKLGKRKLKPKRVGVYVLAIEKGLYSHINIDNVEVKDVFANNSEFIRSYKDTTSANGLEEYGFGMFFISMKGTELSHVTVNNSHISNVSHTGIKFNGKRSINNVILSNNKVFDTGGPGMQMSGVMHSHVHHNEVNGSGSNKDARNWARGSGMWTWGSSDIIVEHNKFLNAKGPGDSAGFHIDFNCNNIIVQYNLSANNAGGFLEILGNNYNNAYRYNVSINDGYRVKKKGVAFQEGKTFWLSGFVGSEVKNKKRRPKKRHGPYNSYLYNNTIFVKDEITAKMAVTRVAQGAVVANNIFHIMGNSKLVAGDQYVPENKKDKVKLDNFIFENNLFLKQSNWPKEVLVQDNSPIYGDAKFVNPGGFNIEDYTPTNLALVQDKGIEIPTIIGDKIGLIVGLKAEKDILGNPIQGKPDLGAIEVSQK